MESAEPIGLSNVDPAYSEANNPWGGSILDDALNSTGKKFKRGGSSGGGLFSLQVHDRHNKPRSTSSSRDTRARLAHSSKKMRDSRLLNQDKVLGLAL